MMTLIQSLPLSMSLPGEIEKPIVAKLREWILTQPQLINPITDELFLLRFLRFKKFDLSAAMKAFALYMRNRELYPLCYKQLDVTEYSINDLFMRGYIFPLFEKDSQGRTIIMVRNGAFGQRFGHRATDLYRSLVMTLETLLCDEENQKKGLVYIVDFEGQSVADVAYVGILEAQRIARSGEKCFPVQHKEAHWVNASMVIRACFRLLISFLPEHLKKRVRMHRNVQALQSCIGTSRLPAEYGGTISWTVMAQSWIDRLTANRPFLLALDDMNYDESLARVVHGA